MRYLQVAALFHIANSKGPPPLPENISSEARDFLLLCFARCHPQLFLTATYARHTCLGVRELPLRLCHFMVHGNCNTWRCAQVQLNNCLLT